jgi:small subunit ribosomal protein S6
MKRAYEVPVVFRIMPEEDFQIAIDQVVAWIEKSNEFEDPGTVTKIDRNRLGRRRLAYEIDGQRDGWYVLFYADIDARHLPELELNLKLYEGVLRYLFLRHEAEAEPKPAVPKPIETDDDEEEDNDE